LNDLASFRVKEEIIAFDDYVSSVNGVQVTLWKPTESIW
jgi:hypothetical protein